MYRLKCLQPPSKSFSMITQERSIVMKVGYKSEEYSILEESFGIDIGFTMGQSDTLRNGEDVVLTPQQLDQVTDQLEAKLYITKYSNSLSPLSMSLFIVNDALWKMMEKKLWEPEKMLAMTTFPICSWDPRAEKTSNPKGVKREKAGPGKISLIEEPRPTLSLSGEGGDFSGFIEQSHLTARKFGVPESRRYIPNYMFCEARIDAVLDRARIEIHPNPRDLLDYDFSESARVFHDHGVLISLPGEDITLAITDRKPAQMKGDGYLLIGTRVGSNGDAYRGLLVDLWLWLFARRFG